MQTSVLWADRNCVFTVLGQHYLEAAGISVETAESAVQCIRQLKLGMHDILILDDSLLWGGIDGILWWIADTVPADEQPRIIVSGVDPPAKLSSRTGINVEHCLQKPYRLLTVLEAVSSTQRQLDEARPRAPQYADSMGGVAPIDRTGRRSYDSRSLPADVAVRSRYSPQRASEMSVSAAMTETVHDAELTVCGIKDVINGVAQA